MRSHKFWLPVLAFFGESGVALGQERYYEWHWQMHPMWWWGGVGMMAMMFLFWVMFIVGIIVAIRWLVGKGRERTPDSALEILRQRYARGEINEEEFESRRKNLAG